MSDEEDLDDEAMMSLDAGLAALFSEQKKKMEAKREQKFKVTKERTLIIEFKMKVPPLFWDPAGVITLRYTNNRALSASQKGVPLDCNMWEAISGTKMQSFSEMNCDSFSIILIW